MNRRARILAIVAGLVVLAAVVAALGFAFTRGGTHEIRLPGRIAVRAGCGLQHMYIDASDQRKTCLHDVFDTVSVSRNGDKLAWDTTGGSTIYVSGIDGLNPLPAAVPPGFNSAPSLSPDGKKIAFLHSPRNDGLYDIWVTSPSVADAEQETYTRNVSDVAWSPTGDWLAYVQNWSEDTLEGQVSLIRPNGDDAHTLVDGDAPDWSPDGKRLVYVHNGSIWTVNADGTDAHRLIKDGSSPAWSRNGEFIAFMRAQKCARNICPENVYLAFADGTHAHSVGPLHPSESQVVWLPDPFE
jgi:dipeptidyl aminopeptidase/acylaminoacyl peptidase